MTAKTTPTTTTTTPTKRRAPPITTASLSSNSGRMVCKGINYWAGSSYLDKYVLSYAGCPKTESKLKKLLQFSNDNFKEYCNESFSWPSFVRATHTNGWVINSNLCHILLIPALVKKNVKKLFCSHGDILFHGRVKVKKKRRTKKK